MLGEDRGRLLHAMTTNNIQQLTPGTACYAYFLNAQGRILADVNVLCRSDDLLQIAPYRGDLIQKALQTGSLVSRPFRSPFLYPDERGELRADRPTMVAAAVVRGDGGWRRACRVLGHHRDPFFH